MAETTTLDPPSASEVYILYVRQQRATVLMSLSHHDYAGLSSCVMLSTLFTVKELCYSKLDKNERMSQSTLLHEQTVGLVKRIVL